MGAWMRSLRDGDEVGLFPQARIGGWRCNTEAARIDVYTSHLAV